MDETDQKILSIKQSYTAMFIFLENYYDTTHSDEIAGLLGGLSRADDGKPRDEAYWNEWVRAVNRAMETSA